MTELSALSLYSFFFLLCCTERGSLDIQPESYMTARDIFFFFLSFYSPLYFSFSTTFPDWKERGSCNVYMVCVYI